jgi:hypothetical protein
LTTLRPVVLRKIVDLTPAAPVPRSDLKGRAIKRDLWDLTTDHERVLIGHHGRLVRMNLSFAHGAMNIFGVEHHEEIVRVEVWSVFEIKAREVVVVLWAEGINRIALLKERERVENADVKEEVKRAVRSVDLMVSVLKLLNSLLELISHTGDAPFKEVVFMDVAARFPNDTSGLGDISLSFEGPRVKCIGVRQSSREAAHPREILGVAEGVQELTRVCELSSRFQIFEQPLKQGEFHKAADTVA